MNTKTNYGLKVLTILSWIIFIGLCVEAGSFICSTIITLIKGPADASRFWMPVNLSGLYNYNQSYFVSLSTIMIIATVLKAIMFYIIVSIFHEKKLNLAQPFNETLKRFVLNLAYLAIGIGIFSLWGARLTENFTKQGVEMPGIQYLRLAGADVWLFMGVTLLVIAQIFNKGIEIQNENELTV